MEGLLVGLANAKNVLPLAPARLKFVLQAISLKKWSTFAISLAACQKAGYNIPNSDAPTVLYNDNIACVKWSYNMTSKTARHIELRDNSVCEWVQDKTLQVKHVAGPLTYSQMKCAMAPTSDIFGTCLCLIFPVF